MTFVEPGGIGQLFATPGFSAWSTTANGGIIAYSNGNNTVTGTSTITNVRGTKVRNLNTGQYYFEMTVPSGYPFKGGVLSMGFVNGPWAPGRNMIGIDVNSFGTQPSSNWIEFTNGGRVGYASRNPPGNADVIGFAINLNYGGSYVVMNLSQNGVWFINNSTTFPVTGDTSLTFSSVAPACSVDNSCSVTLNTGGSPFSYGPPSGFLPWG